jgi:hypothetical protein
VTEYISAELLLKGQHKLRNDHRPASSQSKILLYTVRGKYGNIWLLFVLSCDVLRTGICNLIWGGASALEIITVTFVQLFTLCHLSHFFWIYPKIQIQTTLKILLLLPRRYCPGWALASLTITIQMNILRTNVISAHWFA